MTKQVRVPQLGNEITEAEITEWIVAEGETVEKGDPVVVLTTTKAAIEVEAPVSGTLTKQLVPEGEIVETGAPLAEIG